MKAFGIFNLVALLGLLLIWFGVSGDAIAEICFVVFGGGALVVIDVIWLLVLGCVRLGRAGAKHPVPQRPLGRTEITLVEFLKKARARGMDDGEADEQLGRNGWSAADIQRARGLLDATQQVKGLPEV